MKRGRQNTRFVFVKAATPQLSSRCKIKSLIVLVLSANRNLSVVSQPFLGCCFAVIRQFIYEPVLRRVVRELCFDLVLQLSAGLKQTMPHSKGAGKSLTDHCV